MNNLLKIDKDFRIVYFGELLYKLLETALELFSWKSALLIYFEKMFFMPPQFLAISEDAI